MKTLHLFFALAAASLLAACHNPQTDRNYHALLQVKGVMEEGVGTLEKQQVRFEKEMQMMADSMNRLKHDKKDEVLASMHAEHKVMMSHHYAVLQSYKSMLAEAQQMEAQVQSGALASDDMYPKLKALEKKYTKHHKEYQRVLVEHAEEFNHFVEQYKDMRPIVAHAKPKKHHK